MAPKPYERDIHLDRETGRWRLRPSMARIANGDGPSVAIVRIDIYTKPVSAAYHSSITQKNLESGVSLKVCLRFCSQNTGDQDQRIGNEVERVNSQVRGTRLPIFEIRFSAAP